MKTLRYHHQVSCITISEKVTFYVQTYPDVTDYEIGLKSINISFTVPYLLEEEEYYIVYGFNSDELYSTSDSIPSVSNTSLENQTYTIFLEGLEVGTIYFAQVVAEFGVSGEFKRYSDTFVFRTKEYGTYFKIIKDF